MILLRAPIILVILLIFIIFMILYIINYIPYFLFERIKVYLRKAMEYLANCITIDKKGTI